MTSTNKEVEVKVEPSKTETASSWWPSSWSSSVKTPSPDTGTNSVGRFNPLNWFSSTQSTTIAPSSGGRYSRKSRRRHRRSKKGGKKRKSLRFRQGG